jgi:hypothetical protein
MLIPRQVVPVLQAYTQGHGDRTADVPTHRRELLRKLATAGLLGGAGISGFIREALADQQNPVRQGVRKMYGNVLINGKKIKPGALIQPGDTIETAPDAKAVYVIGQDAFLQRGSTAVHFGSGATAKVMRVLTGKILSVFGKGERSIMTSTATMGIRGTGCYIDDEGSGASARTYFCLCYGEVTVTPTAAPQEQLSYKTEHHDYPVFIYNELSMPRMVKPQMMLPAGVIDHTDAELILLESLVGRQVPFSESDSYY